MSKAVRFVLCCAIAVPATGALAQSYPTKPIRMIVAYPPGGGTDIVGRMVAQKLSENFGQTVVIDNRGGAAGGIGSEIAAHSVPDGYTILMGNVAPNAINVSLYAKLGYDPVKDFEPVSLVASTPNILVVQPSLAVKTVPELIALAKAKPGSLNYPSAGLGSSSHLAGELFDNLAGVKMVHIPYKGGGPGADRSARRPGAVDVRDHAGGHAARALGPAARNRSHERQAFAGDARITDNRRDAQRL
jgi:tripartite-type tricarboxylate transporter receptor subunit TctC